MGAVEEMMFVVCVDVTEWTLCKYGLMKGDLLVLSWARVQRVMRGSNSSELIMCGGGVRSILLLPLVARCLETIDVCLWRVFIHNIYIISLFITGGFSLIIICIIIKI